MEVLQDDFEAQVKGHLLASGCVSDAAFLSKTGECIYLHGKHLGSSDAEDQEASKNFSELCRIVDSTKTNFDLDIGPDSITFRIFHRTLCSVYATCDGGLYTLVVCDCPVGTLVCLSSPPVIANRMIPVVEKMADKLRA
jgi:hypothetical protein